jgi:hypothetical protein
VTSVVNGADVVPMTSQGALDDLRDEIVTTEGFDDLCSIEPQCFSMAQYVGGSLSKVRTSIRARVLRIARIGFGTGRQKMALERGTNPKRSRRTCMSSSRVAPLTHSRVNTRSWVPRDTAEPCFFGTPSARQLHSLPTRNLRCVGTGDGHGGAAGEGRCQRDAVSEQQQRAWTCRQGA